MKNDMKDISKPVQSVLMGLMCEEPDVELNQVEWRKLDGKGWAKAQSVMDSGAAESVAPPSLAPDRPSRPSVGSARGQHYLSGFRPGSPRRSTILAFVSFAHFADVC